MHLSKKALWGKMSFRLLVPPLRGDRAIMLAGWVLKVGQNEARQN